MTASARSAAMAGLFYPVEPGALNALIAQYLADAAPVAARPPKLVLVPHAGYAYSGPVAAHAYALLAPGRGHIRRAVLLGPAHRVAVRGLAAPSVAAFDSPLGRVAID